MRETERTDLLTRGSLDRRQFLAGAGATVGGIALFGLSACGQGASGGSLKSGKNQQAVTHLDDIISPVAFHVATQEGFFKQQKLELESIGFPGGADVIRAIQTKMPWGLGAPIATMIAFSKQFPDARIVGGAFNSTEIVFMVPKDSPIKRVEDLNGKTIGVSEPGSNTTYFGNLLIDKYKLDGAKIDYVGGPPDAMTAAQKGVVDVGWASAPFSTQLIKEGKARILIDTRELEPHYSTSMLVAKKGVLDEDRAKVRAWMKALGKANDVIQSDPARAGKDWAKAVNIDPAIATKAIKDYSEAFTLKIDQRTLDSSLRAGKALKQIDGKVDFKTLIDDQTKGLT